MFVPSQGLAPDGSKSLSYTYDIYDQLTGESSSGKGNYGDSYGFAFSYDLAGNAPSFPGQTRSTYNADNQQSGPSYNGNGDPSSAAGGQSASWDAENRLTGIGSAIFSYDPDGLRASKTAGLSTTFFLYDGETPLLEENAAGQVTAANGMAAGG